MPSLVEDLRKIIQDLVTPELREVKTKVENLDRRIADFEKHMNERFDQLVITLNLTSRVEALERDRKESKAS